MDDVHDAIGAPPMVAAATAAEHPDCPVERAVIAALAPVFEEADALIHERCRAATLGDVVRGSNLGRQGQPRIPAVRDRRSLPGDAAVGSSFPGGPSRRAEDEA